MNWEMQNKHMHTWVNRRRNAGTWETAVHTVNVAYTVQSVAYDECEILDNSKFFSEHTVAIVRGLIWMWTVYLWDTI